MAEYDGHERSFLHGLANQAMLDRGFQPDFEPDVLAELARIDHAAAAPTAAGVRDLCDRLWCSIDNDDSRDLDQLTWAEPLDGGSTRVLVAVADVDALVGLGSAIDRHARASTTSVYCPGSMFPMLPEKLSTGLTSLNEGEDRLAIVTELVVDADGLLKSQEIYRAQVHNQAQLAYDAVTAFLDGTGSAPVAIQRAPGLDAALRIQDEVAGRLLRHRTESGALELETIDPQAKFDGEQLVGIQLELKNRARKLIEDFMIAANEAAARFLAGRGVPSLRRVVREPERWPRIVEVARAVGYALPEASSSLALQGFLKARKAADPLRFPDLSLTIVKLLGAGEYVATQPGDAPLSHFGLAVSGYAHSTAPNRRYADVITQRQIKAAIAGSPPPYAFAELNELAQHCTVRENEANRVERQLRKSAAAMLLAPRIGERFDALVTGVAASGNWVRLIDPPVEGKLVGDGAEVGQDAGTRSVPGVAGAGPGVAGAGPGVAGAGPGVAGAAPGVAGAGPGGSVTGSGGPGAELGGAGKTPGVDVGDELRVELLRTDVRAGFIDFARR